MAQPEDVAGPAVIKERLTFGTWYNTSSELRKLHADHVSLGQYAPSLNEAFRAARAGRLWWVSWAGTGLSNPPTALVIATDAAHARQAALPRLGPAPLPVYSLNPAHTEIDQMLVPELRFDRTIVNFRWVKSTVVLNLGSEWTGTLDRIAEHIVGRRDLSSVLNDLESLHQVHQARGIIGDKVTRATLSSIIGELLGLERGVRSRGAPETIEGMIAMYRHMIARGSP
jgi:hypothetical protein